MIRKRCETRNESVQNFGKTPVVLIENEILSNVTKPSTNVIHSKHLLEFLCKGKRSSSSDQFCSIKKEKSYLLFGNHFHVEQSCSACPAG